MYINKKPKIITTKQYRKSFYVNNNNHNKFLRKRRKRQKNCIDILLPHKFFNNDPLLLAIPSYNKVLRNTKK